MEQHDSEVQRLILAGELVTIREASAVAGLSELTIRKRIRQGLLRAWGAPRRVALSELLPRHEPDAEEVVSEADRLARKAEALRRRRAARRRNQAEMRRLWANRGKHGY